nr:hypothetical protein [Mycobacterium sp. IS-1590]
MQAPIRVQQQHGEQFALLGSAEIHRSAAVASDSERTQDAEFRQPGHDVAPPTFTRSA